MKREACPRCGSRKFNIDYRSEQLDMKWCSRCVKQIGLNNIKKLESKIDKNDKEETK